MNIKNTGNSCYLDSLIVAMYGYNKSPFLYFLNKTPLQRSIKQCLNTTSSMSIRQSLPFGRAQQDPGETYHILLNDINYEPMTIMKIRQVKKINQDRVYKKKSTTEKSACINIDNTGKDISFKNIIEPAWEVLSNDNLINDSKDNPVYNRTRNLLFFTQADCLVFYFNRCQNTTNKFKNKLQMPQIFETNNCNYFCFAIIVHIGNHITNGHYITILYDGNNSYYIYDDMSEPTVNKIEYNDNLKDFIERNCVMFFYYKN